MGKWASKDGLKFKEAKGTVTLYVNNKPMRSKYFTDKSRRRDIVAEFTNEVQRLKWPEKVCYVQISHDL